MPEVKKTKPSTKTTEIELGSLGQLLRGRGIARSDISTTGYPCLRYGEIYTTYDNFVECLKSCLSAQAATSAQSLETGDIVFAASGETADEIGKSVAYIGPTPAFAGSDTLILRDHGQDPVFLAHLLNSEDVRIPKARLGKGYSVVHIHAAEISKIRISLPPISMQRKIARILRTWDEVLEKLAALRAAKERRAIAVRQGLFESDYASHNQLQCARNLFEPVSERGRSDLPLLAVMQDIGIVKREDLGRRVTMPDGDTLAYKVVRPGDFVISLRSFEGGLECSAITGLVSPAYTVLRPVAGAVGDYYRHFFKSRSFIGRLDKLIFGIRDGKQIAFRDFGNMHIPAPPRNHQARSAHILGLLETEIACEQKRIEVLTRQKCGMMQKLLTGRCCIEAEGY